jgi:hypothetical protein
MLDHHPSIRSLPPPAPGCIISTVANRSGGKTMVLVLLIGLLAATAWTAAFALGTLLVYRGLRGKLIDHDPRCRKCGYNLVASPHRPGRCPECGAQIYGLGTIRLGARRRRQPLIVLGAALMLLCLCPIGFALLPESGTGGAAPAAATSPASVVALPPAVVVQEPLFADPKTWPAPREASAAPSQAPAEPEETPITGGDAEAAAEHKTDAGPRWYRLRSINGCCPYCAHPVGPMSRSPSCPGCGRNIAD